MADSTVDDLEPLFDYHRVQPRNFVSIDDDDSDASPAPSPKKPKSSPDSAVEKVGKVDEEVEIIKVVECEEDWLPAAPEVSSDVQAIFDEDPAIKELRLKKQELISFTQSAENMLRELEESVRKELSNSQQPSLEAAAQKPQKPERSKIVISIQDENELKHFRIYADDKFERLMKMYADKCKLELQSLVFSFDGDKINPAETPEGLGMEDNDIIEVHAKRS